jgi:Leucine-rich repeat (LRR) protein
MPEDLRRDILKRTEPYYGERTNIEREIYLNDFRDKIRVYKSGSRFHPIHHTYFNGDQDLYSKHRDKVAIGFNEYQRLCRSEEIYCREHIILQGWGLKTIPEQIFEIEGLRSLSLEYNKLMKVSNNILNLKSLKTLSLDYNHFKNFPEALINLPSLEFLSLDNNFISTIPISITGLNVEEFVY